MKLVRQDSTPKKDVCAPKFLASYRNSGNIRASCEAAGIDRQTYYNWRESFPDFDEACKHASDEALDTLEAAGWLRARKSSDTLLIFFLKAGRPEKYRDHHIHEVVKRYQDMSDDELTDALTARLGALTAGREDRPAGETDPEDG